MVCSRQLTTVSQLSVAGGVTKIKVKKIECISLPHTICTLIFLSISFLYVSRDFGVHKACLFQIVIIK